MEMDVNKDVVYVIVNNIPTRYHSVDLRNFFSHFIESGGFACFHFRHRPEVQKPSTSNDADRKTDERSRRVTTCCVAKVYVNRVEELIKTYNGEHWLNKNGETLISKCYIKRISFRNNSQEDSSNDSGLCKQGTVTDSLPLNQVTFSPDDIDSLIEMHPPSCMPNGNVGTKTSHFLGEIRACRLPPSIIVKLGLQFPRNRARRIYGSVPFSYQKKRDGKGEEKCNQPTVHSRGTWAFKAKNKNSSDDPRQQKEYDEEEEESSSEEEEWDRHEALHDDVTAQERTKERLFEEEIELQWEKGGSGLVFYTDATFWDEKEGDFDAKTSDDWDIDMGIYRDPIMANDRDARDLLQMRLENRRRDGSSKEDENINTFAAFEKHTTGFGRRVLESQGWKQGQGIGKKSGISEPIPNDGQHPRDKKGFGYRGEKLKPSSGSHRKTRRRRRFSDETCFISTIYDDPLETDPPEPLRLSSVMTKLKYRQEFLKSKSNS